MLKKCLLIIFLFDLIFAQGFNIVQNNDLNSSRYSMINFKQDFINGDKFLCVNNFDEWGNNVNFKDIWKVEFTDNEGFNIVNENNGIRIGINNNNFQLFHDSFIGNECLKFTNQFPVKFFKVKTAHALNKQFAILKSPGGKKIDLSDTENYLFYYGYKKTIVGSKEYVLLGLSSKFDIQIHRDIQKEILGWVLYKENNNPVNTVLWNTNIGLRPDENNFSNLQIYNTNKNYTGDNILVSEEGIKKYVDRYMAKNGQVNRWLPLYKSNYNDNTKIPIGIIEKIGEKRRDLQNLVTTKEFNIVYLIDNTASMRPVWSNLDITIKSSIKSLLNNFTNIAGDSITPKIKILYYSDDVRILNEYRWISTVKDLEDYSDVISSIKPINSRFYRPEITNAFDYIFDNMNDQPLYVVVIGDAGDHIYHNSFFDIYKERLNGNLIIPKGVRYNSDLSDLTFPFAYNEFKMNFELLYDIPNKLITREQASLIGDKIADEIRTDFNYIIKVYPEIIKGPYKPDINNIARQSIFATNYLKSLSNDLNSFGSGTYYEEGYLPYKNGNLFKKDILIDESKLKLLKQAMTTFRNDNSEQNLKFAIRQICAAFFEIDFYLVTDEFLLNTDIKKFWTQVVGSQDIAEQLMPEIFTSNKTFAEICDNADKYINKFNLNSELIIENIINHLNTHKGKYYEVRDPETSVVEKYYWVEVETLNIFEGIN